MIAISFFTFVTYRYLFKREKMTVRTVELDFEYQNIIEAPPLPANQMYSQACANDSITISTWKEQWIAQCKQNHAKYGPFKDKSIGQFYGQFHQRPALVVGSGPSLKNNIVDMKDPKTIPIISCLHNFHFMVDNEIPVQAFVTLDAGEITVEEMYEGGQKTKEEYFALTKNYPLFAYICSNPKLLELWQGPIYFFTSPLPDPDTTARLEEVEKFGMYVSTGGNVLGACLYIAKAVWGCNPIAYAGADFAFSFESGKKFHSWNSKYDGKLGHAMRAINVYGHKVYTWASYFNFKNFFDWVACNIPGIYVNCTEGGLLGAYPEGNLMQIIQLPLKHFIRQYSMYEEMRFQCEHPELMERKILY